MPLDKLPLETVTYITQYLDNSIVFYLKLAQVCRAWRSLFKSDYLWAKFNVYGVDNNISKHSLEVERPLYAQLQDLLEPESSTNFENVDPQVWRARLQPWFTNRFGSLRYHRPLCAHGYYPIEYLPADHAAANLKTLAMHYALSLDDIITHR